MNVDPTRKKSNFGNLSFRVGERRHGSNHWSLTSAEHVANRLIVYLSCRNLFVVTSSGFLRLFRCFARGMKLANTDTVVARQRMSKTAAIESLALIP